MVLTLAVVFREGMIEKFKSNEMEISQTSMSGL